MPEITGFRSASPLTAMAARLTDAFARECISEDRDALDESDRQSLLVVCEWLLMDWRLLESARLSHIKENLGEVPPSQPIKWGWVLSEKPNECAYHQPLPVGADRGDAKLTGRSRRRSGTEQPWFSCSVRNRGEHFSGGAPDKFVRIVLPAEN
jgi:hypothetical protein